jgi:putative restriction endonuclease
VASSQCYALHGVKQRLHQASFREAVITAYKGRCAVSGLPEPLLLDAAHIVADKEKFGQPVVQSKRPTIHVCDIIVADDMFAL